MLWVQRTRSVTDQLSGVGEPIVIPATEIVHDRTIALHHPLVGTSPLAACAQAATTSIRIAQNSQTFFANMSRPSGILSAPGAISEDIARRLKQSFEENYGASNLGRIAVRGDGLAYQALTIPAADAQLLEQQKMTIADIARAFNVPLQKLAEPGPTFNNVAALNADFFSQALQIDIEAIEVLLDIALGLPADMAVEADLDGLLRMDATARAESLQKCVAGGFMSPNEARATMNLPPVEGGNVPFLQQQNYPISALADRPPPDTSQPKTATDKDFGRFLLGLKRQLGMPL